MRPQQGRVHLISSQHKQIPPVLYRTLGGVFREFYAASKHGTPRNLVRGDESVEQTTPQCTYSFPPISWWSIGGQILPKSIRQQKVFNSWSIP